MDEKWQELFTEAALGLGMENMMEDRDYLYRLLHTIDWDSQLLAIRGMLRRNKLASQAVGQEITESREATDAYKGPHHDHYVEEHVYLLQQSVYSEAAISMAAIGMIAPMLESVFAEAFRELGAMYVKKGMPPPQHKRWELAAGDHERWNVQVYYAKDGTKKRDIIGGINQLSEAAGLKPFLPAAVWKWIGAMLQYRNSMFHGGFEWSEEQRTSFQNRIDQQGWQEYFDSAKSDHKPWVFYLTVDTIDRMPAVMDEILDGLASFAKSLPFELISIET